MRSWFLVASFALLFIGTVSATELFYDGFESGNLNGWEILTMPGASSWNASSLNPPFGNWTARVIPQYNFSIPASAMQKNASTTGYQNITFSYYRRLSGLDIADEFQAKWFDGTEWTIVEQTGNTSVTNTSWIFRSFNLPSIANDNPLLKLRFECTADLSNEDCRVDEVRVTGQSTSAPNISANYVGAFEYVPDNWYSVLINQTSHTATFRGLNASNQYGLFVVQIDSQNRFSKRINYVWFDGWFDNSNLYINQYVGTGGLYYGVASQFWPGTYSGLVTLPNSVYWGINSPIVVNLTVDTYDNKATFSPVAYLGAQSLAYFDSEWNASGHSYGPVLYQSALLQNNTFEVSEWVKEDLASNGLNPRWTVPLVAV